MAMENAQNKQTLFREKAVRHSLNLSEGTVVEWNSKHKFAVILILIILILLISYFFFISHQLTVKAPGEVTFNGSQFLVYSPSSGVIDLAVSEGEMVKGGQKLFRVSRKDISDGEYIDKKISIEQEKQKNILNKTVSLLNLSLANLQHLKEKRIAKIEKVIAAEKRILDKHQEFLTLLRDDMKNLIALAKKDFVGSKEIIDAKKALLIKEIEVEEVKKSLNRMIGTKAQIDVEYKADRLAILAKLQDSNLTLSALNERISISKKTTDRWVTTNISGKVSSIFAADSEYVSKKDPVLKIISDDSYFIIKAFLGTRSMEGINIGKDVVIKFHSLPSIKHGIFHGKITKISDDVMPASKLPSHLNKTRNYFQILITVNQISLKKVQNKLKNGMTADIEILGKKRTMFEWLTQKLVRGKTYE